MADDSGSTRFRALYESALQTYQKTTDVTLSEHSLAVQLHSCDSAESITTLLEYETRAFSDLRGRDRTNKSIESTVSILYTLFPPASFGEAIDLPYPPAKAIHAGLAILLAAASGDNSNYDPLVDLLESIVHILKRAHIYTQISPTPMMDEIMLQMVVELLSTLALATKELKQGLSIKSMKKFFREEGIEAVLQRLDRLTPNEARFSASQTLDVVHGLVRGMKVVMEGGDEPVDGIRKSIEILHHVVSDMNRPNRDKLQQDIYRWLSPPDPWENHIIARESRHNGTGAWFVQGNMFSEWKSLGLSSLLWIHGIPGAGKTILCSTIIEEINTMRKSGLASLAMFYHDFGDDEKNSRRALLSSVLVQLCHQSDSYCDILSKFCLEHASGSRYPSDDALVRCLKDVMELPRQAPIFLIVDALDECPNTTAMPSPREEVLMLLEDLIDSEIPNLRICVTSRREDDIESVLSPLALHAVPLHSQIGQRQDIMDFIHYVVASSRNMQKLRKWRPGDKKLVIDTLSKKADGMFRWIYCQLDFLHYCLPQRIRHALKELPETLDETYERTLQGIDSANWKFVHRLFQCVAVASRPLDVEELAEFLAFDFGAGSIPDFNPDWRSEDPIYEVLSTCSGFLMAVNVHGSEIIRFSHYSVKEFLTSERIAKAEGTVSRFNVLMEPAHTTMAQACLALLLNLSPNSNESTIASFPLAHYAAQHWVDHALFEETSLNIQDGMKKLFDLSKPYFAVWVSICDTIPGFRLQTAIQNVLRLVQTPTGEDVFRNFRDMEVLEHTLDTVRGQLHLLPLYMGSEEAYVWVTQLLLADSSHAKAHVGEKRILLPWEDPDKYLVDANQFQPPRRAYSGLRD